MDHDALHLLSDHGFGHINAIIMQEIVEREVEDKARAIVKEFPMAFWNHFEMLRDEESGKAHADVDRVVGLLGSIRI